MKRSEAVDNIACVLVANAPYVQAIDIMEIARISEEIMKDIEDRTKMLPPDNGTGQYIGTAYMSTHLDYSKEPIYKWDKE